MYLNNVISIKVMYVFNYTYHAHKLKSGHKLGFRPPTHFLTGNEVRKIKN